MNEDEDPAEFWGDPSPLPAMPTVSDLERDAERELNNVNLGETLWT